MTRHALIDFFGVVVVFLFSSPFLHVLRPFSSFSVIVVARTRCLSHCFCIYPLCRSSLVSPLQLLPVQKESTIGALRVARGPKSSKAAMVFFVLSTSRSDEERVQRSRTADYWSQERKMVEIERKHIRYAPQNPAL